MDSSKEALWLVHFVPRRLVYDWSKIVKARAKI